jgi:branched-chain amino acid transport system ATP-binding protein
MHILEVEKLCKNFGGLAAVSDVDFHIEQHEILGLIGPNGAGKTTTFNLVSGTIVPTSGTVRFKAENIVGLKAHQICHRGMARTFQSVNLFPYMTARENILVGALFGARSSMSQARKEADGFLEYVGLADKANTLAKGLTLADKKRLEVARALATRPELLLLDEMMAGLNTTEMVGAIELIRKTHAQGITILMIEHVMQAVMGISHRIVVLHYGKKLAEGTPHEITNNKEVIEVYLGDTKSVKSQPY